MRKQSYLPVTYAIAAALLFGASAPLAKLFLSSAEPMPLAALLYLGSGFGLLAVKLVFHKRTDSSMEASIVRNDLLWLSGAVFSGGVIAPIILMFSLRVTPASTASLLLNFESVSTALIAILVFKESADKRVWSAITLITAASIMLSWNTSGQWGLTLGAVGIMGACVFWGIDNNLTCKISLKDPVSIVTIKGTAAGSFSLIMALMLGYSVPDIRIVLLAMLLGFVCYGLSIVLFIKALRELGSSRTSALFGTAPFIGSVLSFIIFRDSQGMLFYISIPIIITGVVLLLKEKHEHTHVHSSITHEHRHFHNDEHHDHHSGEGVPAGVEHSHLHTHDQVEHKHTHRPDIHHKHIHSH